MRAFKSTLEDIEEKRSIHSFHSLHSLRQSRSHCSRPLCEETLGGGAGTKQNGSYVNMALSVTSGGRSRSRSLETINTPNSAASPCGVVTTNTSSYTTHTIGGASSGTAAAAGGIMSVPTVVIQGASPSPSRTFSDPELNETSI